MSVINITPPSQQIPADRFSLFAMGFRPFFILAALAGVLLIGAWVAVLSLGTALQSPYGEILWHSHEMVFGFAVAVIAGFLLTAVRNWTSAHTLTGPPLIAMAILWLAGRVLALLPVPNIVLALVDLLFLPALAIALLMPIIKANKKPQLIFVAIVMLMFVANLLVHLQLLGVTAASAEAGIRLGMNAILLTIIIMAGRVLPFFIERGAPGTTPKKWPWLEKLAVATFLFYMLWELLFGHSLWFSMLAALMAGIHCARLWAWYERPIWQVPLLWVLVLGYGWLLVGFVLMALSATPWASVSLANHAFAASIAVLSLGMMARVALGHTGRELKPAKLMSWAFALLNIAMLLRVFGIMLMPDMVLLTISGLAWMAAFAIYAIVYWPILSRARIDGQPG